MNVRDHPAITHQQPTVWRRVRRDDSRSRGARSPSPIIWSPTSTTIRRTPSPVGSLSPTLTTAAEDKRLNDLLLQNSRLEKGLLTSQQQQELLDSKLSSLATNFTHKSEEIRTLQQQLSDLEATTTTTQPRPRNLSPDSFYSVRQNIPHVLRVEGKQHPTKVIKEIQPTMVTPTTTTTTTTTSTLTHTQEVENLELKLAAANIEINNLRTQVRTVTLQLEEHSHRDDHSSVQAKRQVADLAAKLGTVTSELLKKDALLGAIESDHKQQLGHANAEIAALTTLNTAGQQRIAQLAAQLEANNNILANKEQQISDLNTQLAAATSLKQDADAVITERDRSLSEAQQQLHLHTLQLRAKEAEIVQLESDKAEWLQRKLGSESTSHQLMNAERNMAELRTELAAVVLKKDEADITITEKTTMLAKLQCEVDAASSNLLAKEAQLCQLEAEKEGWLQQQSLSKDTLHTKDKALTDAQLQLTTLTSQLTSKDMELRLLESEKEELLHEKEHLEDTSRAQAVSCRESVSTLTAELTIAHTNLQEREIELSRLRTELEEYQVKIHREINQHKTRLAIATDELSATETTERNKQITELNLKIHHLQNEVSTREERVLKVQEEREQDRLNRQQELSELTTKLAQHEQELITLRMQSVTNSETTCSTPTTTTTTPTPTTTTITSTEKETVTGNGAPHTPLLPPQPPHDDDDELQPHQELPSSGNNNHTTTEPTVVQSNADSVQAAGEQQSDNQLEEGTNESGAPETVCTEKQNSETANSNTSQPETAASTLEYNKNSSSVESAKSGTDDEDQSTNNLNITNNVEESVDDSHTCDPNHTKREGDRSPVEDENTAKQVEEEEDENSNKPKSIPENENSNNTNNRHNNNSVITNKEDQHMDNGSTDSSITHDPTEEKDQQHDEKDAIQESTQKEGKMRNQHEGADTQQQQDHSEEDSCSENDKEKKNSPNSDASSSSDSVEEKVRPKTQRVQPSESGSDTPVANGSESD